jgi:dTDP-4-amino-4,6-dideoxygalactose transaminase
MDIDLLESEETLLAAVIPVHMHGQMVDMQRLMKWAQIKNVKVIEDCAQAHGAEIFGKKSGTWGDIGAFSFYPTKNLGGIGDAGAISTNNRDIADFVRSFANYGSVPTNKYEYQFLGINSRLDPIQAAVLSVNLQHLDYWNDARKSIATRYSKGLSELGIPLFRNSEESVFHHYISISENRNKSRSLLKDEGISTEIHYPECAESNFKKITKMNSNRQSSTAIELAKKTISLPISPWIKDSEIEYVIDQISRESIRRSFLSGI